MDLRCGADLDEIKPLPRLEMLIMFLALQKNLLDSYLVLEDTSP